MDPTYELISKQVLTSNQATVIFSNIPQTYKDLYLVISARTDRSLVTDSAIVEFNGVVNSGSTRYLYGDGTSVVSSTESNKIYIAQCTGANATASTFGNSEAYIPNYTSSANKSISVTGVNETNATTAYIFAFANLWPNTSAINSMLIKPNIGPNFTASSSFYLYGIKNADDGGRGFFGPAMTGGNEVYTTGNGYKYHVFKSSGTLNVTTPGEVECLVIGGGGSGGHTVAGGGGGGGVVLSNIMLRSNTYSVIVGAGGASPTQDGLTGSNSSVGIITSNGGGGGGGYSNRAGLSGGSGGGGGGGETGTNSTGGLAISGQGNNGGTGRAVSSTFSGGGGGGAGAVGQNSPDASGGAGGAGTTYWGTTYAGGGSGGTNNSTPRSGGTGGGGVGGGLNLAGSAGTANTGGGGGGGGNGSANVGYAGGSGIVIIRYRI